MTFEPDASRDFKLPASGSPSLLYVFSAETTLGARAYSETGEDFAPGTAQSRVRLDFLAEDEWTDIVRPGATFTIWYGGDVGHGVIEEIL